MTRSYIRRVHRGPISRSLTAAFSALRRCSIRAAAIALLLATSPVAAFALFHAALLHSTPAANSHLTSPPGTIRLVFSEAIVPELSRITLTGPDGTGTLLEVANDPHDVHTLVGRVAVVASGAYKVSWRVVSADGHTVGGTFSFYVESASRNVSAGSPAGAASTTLSNLRNSAASDTSGPVPSTAATEVRTLPVFASILRGTGLGAMMAGLGLLLFGTTAGERRRLTARTPVVRLIAIAAIVLVAHMVAWLYDISPNGSLGGDFIAAAFGSTPGKIEALRVVLALLTLWAIGLARRDELAITLGAACLLVSGAVGHPAAIQPFWNIPAKMVHLIAGSVWLGGLLWLIHISRREETAFSIEARRVSAVALWAFFALLFSGSIQTRVAMSSWGDLIHSGYGQLALVKLTGLVVLACYGAYNRFGVLPRIEESGARPSLSRSVKQEIVIIIALILIGGFLANAPTPFVPQSPFAAATVSAR